MFKKYVNVTEYKGDLEEYIKMVNECMDDCIEKITERLETEKIDLVYFNCVTSAGLGSLLRKLNIDSQMLAFRLRYTNGLIQNASINFKDYGEIVGEVLSNLIESIYSDIESNRSGILKCSRENRYRFEVKEYVLNVYLYIIKNIFRETFMKVCNDLKNKNMLKKSIIV